METFIFMRIQYYVLKIHQLCIKIWSDTALFIDSPLAHHSWATIQCSPLSSYHYQKITPCRWYHYQVLLERKIDYENMTSSLTLQLLIEGTGLWYIKSCQTSPRIKQVPFRGCSWTWLGWVGQKNCILIIRCRWSNWESCWGSW